ncbi:site-specific DNA-methyltransferase [Ktedonosporobacter rubrisoli]|uniref:Methyltransferase n=1 Tax=Ktedonosporobacter rubrisoli TaxID=2509675 RepID=A0A4P6JSH0_KTERU|nr:site-specific DNA-methyltransferase [Ktedonosporobacter rubrisoli]QBD78180.1 site-specific DNA-methyltransferase [Ktedonosporobacter rubrisoli]
MAELIWRDKARLANCYVPTQEMDKNTSYENYLVTKEWYTPAASKDAAMQPSALSWYNRLIWGDKNRVLPALMQEFAASINLIYIDPPFMTGRTFNKGEQLAYHDTWNNNLDLYLQWLYETFLQLHALLSPTGSLYIHLDWRVTHYARVLLDEIFGFSPLANGPGFKNEIIWHYQSGGRAQKHYARKHDTILLYTKSAQHCFHAERIGERRGSHKRNHMRKEISADGSVSWSIRSAGRTYTYDEHALMSPSDVWSDISHLHQRDPERTGYATQKPEALLKRIILASSEENDIVLDCFCGSGVTAAVAEQLDRRWITCDSSELAINIATERLHPCIHTPFAIQHIVEEVQSGPGA